MADSADATPDSTEDPRPHGRRRSTRKTTRKTSPAPSTGNTTGTAATAETGPEAAGDGGGDGTKGNATRKPGQKSTPRKTSRKTSRKTATKRADAPAVAQPQEENPVPASAVLAADFDRSQLTPKMRVHALAKLLGMTSKDVIAALDTIGLVKVAQSTLSLEESGALLDALGKPAEEAPGNPDAEPVEKIRQRVEKNVANEIHQIEEKVERELAEHPAEPAGTGPASATQESGDTSAAGAVSIPDSFLASAEAERDAELLEDVVSDITPAPVDEPVFQPPIFRAPTVGETTQTAEPAEDAPTADATTEGDAAPEEQDKEATTATSRRRRRGRRGGSRGRGGEEQPTGEDVSQVEDVEPTGDGEAVAPAAPEEVTEPEPLPEEPVALHGSTRLESQKRRRAEMREENKKKRHIVSQAEFLARRESVDRTMVVRERHRHDHPGLVTQVGVLEDELLVEHFVTSEEQASLIGNIYLGRVQNVLPSMEAAFIDIGKGRNGVLYAGEVDWKAAGLGGRSRRIEQALRSGDQVLVQVTKDPVGHKGARLTTQISLAGRFLVYVPGGRSAGISRKLPAPERKRLKEILKAVVPGQGGAIIRTAAEGVSEEAIGADVQRLHQRWEDIQKAAEKEKDSKGAKPVTMYEEPNMLIKVIRDLFNEDFQRLVVDGPKAWNMVHAYVQSVAPDLLDRVHKFDRAAHQDQDAFGHYRVDEQLQKALSRKVWLPSGGSLVIDRTEAMTVVDVNTGKFTGSGGNLEETVTRNNLEAAEEIVRQLRLRDIGGMIVVDFIDMVLPENRSLVLRRLTESLGRDRTRHQVSEVTSLGLVQLTRKRLGTGLLETFSTECEHCGGRGLILHEDPVEHDEAPVYSKHAKKRPAAPAAPAPHEHPAAQAAHRNTPSAAPVAAETSDPEKSLEELAAAVVVEDGATERDTASGSSRGRGRRGSRGRGRRRSTERTEVVTERRVPVEQPEDEPDPSSELESIVAAAVDRADQEDPAEPSGAAYTAVEQMPTEPKAEAADAAAPKGGYEQAVAEFEASPRRKRRTRGNSRSDHRPDPADYQATDSRVPAGRDTAAELPETGQPVTPAEAPAETPAPRGRRNRRRVVRRHTGTTGESQVSAPETSPTRQAEPARQDAERADKRSGRGRRRVVRKAPTVSAPSAAPEPEVAPPARKNPTAGARSRSGRRSARRSNR
ncbi:translation initiation factor IF-2 N-terminal domain-containing protein [Corynebacterium halotolerans]|uniref:translation initiation factor IF-2 N-terminal domain-containing protein n=1 Tax=Corynebacterium halotolerans TaxID=225326 RepID=UPI003CF529BA